MVEQSQSLNGDECERYVHNKKITQRIIENKNKILYVKYKNNEYNSFFLKK